MLGCAAMISWTLAARLIPIHPCDSGSSGMSWCIYFRSCVHFLTHTEDDEDDDDSSSLDFRSCVHFLTHDDDDDDNDDDDDDSSLAVLSGRNLLKKTIAMIPNIPQYPGLYVSLP